MSLRKITSIIIAVSITAALISGCSSTKLNSSTSNTDTSVASSAATPDPNTKSDNKRGGIRMNDIYSSVLKALVADNTITQAQSDKVLETLSKAPGNGAQGKGNNSNGGSTGDGNQSNGAPQANGDQPKGTPPANGFQQNGGGRGNGARPNGGLNSDRLSELVKSNVITQTQADTIIQKIQEAMKNNQPSAPNSTPSTKTE